MAQNLFKLTNGSRYFMNVERVIKDGVITCTSYGNQGGTYQETIFSLDTSRPGTYTLCANLSSSILAQLRIILFKQGGTEEVMLTGNDVYQFTISDTGIKMVNFWVNIPPTKAGVVVYKPMLVINAVDKEKFPLWEPYKPAMNIIPNELVQQNNNYIITSSTKFTFKAGYYALLFTFNSQKNISANYQILFYQNGASILQITKPVAEQFIFFNLAKDANEFTVYSDAQASVLNNVKLMIVEGHYDAQTIPYYEPYRSMTRVKLYENCPLTTDRNRLIECNGTLENDFLAHYLGVEFDKFNYVKHGLNISLKVPIDKNGFDVNARYNYILIYNQGEELPRLYFILNREILSDKAVKYDLKMDTLNTFWQYMNFTDRCKVKRKMFDRFVEQDYTAGSMNLLRLINKNAEGINPTLEYKSTTTISMDPIDTNWYLIYKTPDDVATDLNNPIDVLLCADEQLPIEASVSTTPITLALTPNNYYYFWVNDTNGGEISIIETGSQNLLQPALGGTDSHGTLKMYVFYLYDNVVKYYRYYINNSGEPVITEGTLQSTPIILTKIRAYRVSALLQISEYYVNSLSKNIVNSGIIDANYIIPFSQVNRTDQRLIKIIKLPYCPVKCSVDGSGNYSFGDNWDVKNGLVHFNYNMEFDNTQTTNNRIRFQDYLIYYVSPSTTDLPRQYREKDTLAESKFYSSEFYNLNLRYADTFTTIHLENLNYKAGASYPVPTLTFKATNTINSNFAFSVNFNLNKNETSQTYWYEPYDLYENYLFINRNNEMSIFNNAWINYVNSGNYNTDRTNFTLASSQRWLNIASGAGSYLVGLNVAAMAGKSLTGKIGTGIGLGASLIDAAIAQVSANNSYEQKLKDLQLQATSVRGSTDIDLMSWYSQNKLLIEEKEPNEIVKSKIYDVFYYCGYTTDSVEKPVFNTRWWFDYIEFTPDFDTDGDYFLIDPYINDIIERCENGVTIFHYHNATDGNWDHNWNLSQTLENWENWLCEEL